MPGIINKTRLAAAVTKTSSAALTTTGLTSPIAVSQKQKIRWWLPITVGATGGIQFQVAVPAAVVSFVQSIVFHNLGAGTVPGTVITASAATGNALANAGNHFVEIEVDIVNGVNAGTVDLQIAQNTSDILTATLLAGASQEVTIY